MAKTHKAQHWVPKSYLKSWTDKSAPTNQEPYVHVFSKDGSESRKKAPLNLFTETDLYTIHQPDGGRDLRLERGLCGLETSFSEIRRNFLSERKHVPLPRYVKLVAFTSAMHARTPSLRDHFMGFWKEVLEVGEELERKMKVATPEERRRAVSPPFDKDRPSITLEDVRNITANPMQHTLGPHLAAEIPLMMQMRCTVLCTTSKIGFITSDTPVVWFDPQWHTKPPLFRAPAFADPALEITLPVSPSQVLTFMHGEIDPSRPVIYRDVSDTVVSEINRRTRFHCNKEFIVRTQATEPRWFERGELPSDDWEFKQHGAAV